MLYNPLSTLTQGRNRSQAPKPSTTSYPSETATDSKRPLSNLPGLCISVPDNIDQEYAVDHYKDQLRFIGQDGRLNIDKDGYIRVSTNSAAVLADIQEHEVPIVLGAHDAPENPEMTINILFKELGRENQWTTDEMIFDVSLTNLPILSIYLQTLGYISSGLMSFFEFFFDEGSSDNEERKKRRKRIFRAFKKVGSFQSSYVGKVRGYELDHPDMPHQAMMPKVSWLRGEVWEIWDLLAFWTTMSEVAFSNGQFGLAKARYERVNKLLGHVMIARRNMIDIVVEDDPVFRRYLDGIWLNIAANRMVLHLKCGQYWTALQISEGPKGETITERSYKDLESDEEMRDHVRVLKYLEGIANFGLRRWKKADLCFQHAYNLYNQDSFTKQEIEQLSYGHPSRKKNHRLCRCLENAKYGSAKARQWKREQEEYSAAMAREWRDGWADHFHNTLDGMVATLDNNPISLQWPTPYEGRTPGVDIERQMLKQLGCYKGKLYEDRLLGHTGQWKLTPKQMKIMVERVIEIHKEKRQKGIAIVPLHLLFDQAMWDTLDTVRITGAYNFFDAVKKMKKSKEKDGS